MATNNNNTLTKEIVDVARLQIAVDSIPRTISDIITPIIDITPKKVGKVSNKTFFTNTSGGSSTLLTASDKKRWISGFSLVLSKNAACDTASAPYVLGATIDGANSYFCYLGLISLEKQEIVITREFNPPLKIDDGTGLIKSTPNFAAGAMSQGITLQILEEDG